MKISLRLLILFCLLLFLIHLNYLFPDIMEARNFVTAREMTDDGNWIFTTLNGEVRYQKPPLPTWLSAIMGLIFGSNTLWALRVPAALSSVFLIYFLYQFIKRETGSKRLSALSTLIFSTSFLVLMIGKRAEWDIYSYAFALAGTYYFYLTLRSNQKSFLNFSLAGLFIGLSFLSKGPTGIYVICAPFFLAYWIAYGFPKVKLAGWIWMAALAAIIGLSWYGVIYAFDKDNLLEILKIESEARGNRAVKPISRYLSFPVQTGVWAIFSVLSLIYPIVKKKVKNQKPYQFFFWWTVICLILLSLVPSKKERYLFPLMIPLAVTTGFYLYTLIKSKNISQWEKIISKISFGLIGLSGVLSPILIFALLKTEFGFYPLMLSVSLFIIGFLLLRNVFGMTNYKKSIGLNMAFVAATMIFGLPVIDNSFNNNPGYHSLVSQKEMIEKSGLKLYGYNAYSPEVWFKYGKIIPEIHIEKPETIPVENEFFMISIRDMTIVEISEKMKSTGFDITLIDELDDNEVKEGIKNNVDRKKLYLFKVTKTEK